VPFFALSAASASASSAAALATSGVTTVVFVSRRNLEEVEGLVVYIFPRGLSTRALFDTVTFWMAAAISTLAWAKLVVELL